VALELNLAWLDRHGVAALEARGVGQAPSTASERKADLLERARSGDTAALSELYRTHSKRVASQLAPMVPRADLEDLVQDVFIEVFRSLKRFEGRSAFTTWLYRVAMHVALKARRSHGRRRVDVVEEVPDIADPGQGPAELALSSERQARVEALLQKLAPKKRAVLVMHDLNGMDYAQIAEVTQTPILTVRTRLFYARRELEALAAEDPALAEFFTPEGNK
jgi:RNA polymerase sigma-70 factor (ECF subfamily)